MASPLREVNAPILLLIAAPAAGLGVEAALEAASKAAQGADVRVMFTDAGLDHLAGPWPDRLCAAGATLALCSRSARARGLDAAATPRSVVWSSLVSFFGSAPATSRIWTLFP